MFNFPKINLIKSFYNFKERFLFDIQYGINTSSPLLLNDFQKGYELSHGKSYYASSTLEVYKNHHFISNLLKKNIENFDENKSLSKVVRKPEELLNKAVSATKQQHNVLLKELKTTENKLTGRINENIILMKVFK